MVDLNKLVQTADWKSEKHIPVIELVGAAKKGEMVRIKLQVGKEIGHPNTTAHHIRWVKAYFLPEGEKFPYELGKTEFNAHGESTQGPDTSKVYTHHETTFTFKTEKSGTIIAFSYCNIHGLWQNTHELKF